MPGCRYNAIGVLELSTLLGSQLRAEDLLVRVGGDEFAVLLEGLGVEEAQLVAERMCRVVKEFGAVDRYSPFNLGLSIGMAIIDGQRTPLELFSLADIAMYRAKEQGGNQAVLFSMSTRYA